MFEYLERLGSCDDQIENRLTEAARMRIVGWRGDEAASSSWLQRLLVELWMRSCRPGVSPGAFTVIAILCLTPFTHAIYDRELYIVLDMMERAAKIHEI